MRAAASVAAATLARMSWSIGRLAAFDLETTGPDPTEARIVTAAVTATGGELLDEPNHWLVNPGVEIPEGAIAVHGISNDRAEAEGLDAELAVEQILEALSAHLEKQVPIVAFNARFDLTVLDREARRYGLETLDQRLGSPDGLFVIDPHVIDKQVDRYRRGKRTLSAVCEHYGVILDGAHSADADAIAAAALARCLGERDAELSLLELAELHSRQVGWAADQARSLQEYFERQGRTERVEPAWPVIPVLETA